MPDFFRGSKDLAHAQQVCINDCTTLIELLVALDILGAHHICKDLETSVNDLIM